MQFCEVINYKLRVFKIIYNISISLFRNTLATPFGLHTLIKRSKPEVCLRPPTSVNKINDKQK